MDNTKYQETFIANINQANLIFKKAFPNSSFTREFIKEFIKTKKIDSKMLDQTTISEINKAVHLLVENAKVAETRKIQQKYFSELFTETSNKEKFLQSFENDENFRIKFSQLVVVFLSSHNEQELNNEHHQVVAKMILEAINYL